VPLMRAVSSHSLHWVQISQGPISVSGGTNIRPKRGGQQEWWCSKLQACLHSVRGSAENLFPDLRKVGCLVLKDSQVDEEAI
jgi:hypothetical protein